MQLGRLPGRSGLGPRNPCICGDFSNTSKRDQEAYAIQIPPQDQTWVSSQVLISTSKPRALTFFVQAQLADPGSSVALRDKSGALQYLG